MWMSKNQRELLLKYRDVMDQTIDSVKDDAVALNKVHILARIWLPGVYAQGDVREYDGIPYKCVQAHDSTQNPASTPESEPALGMQYHGTSPETARPWIAPAGAHDVYQSGEYMIWTDGQIYKCIQTTNFSPNDYPQAWEAVE